MFVADHLNCDKRRYMPNSKNLQLLVLLEMRQTTTELTWLVSVYPDHRDSKVYYYYY